MLLFLVIGLFMIFENPRHSFSSTLPLPVCIIYAHSAGKDSLFNYAIIPSRAYTYVAYVLSDVRTGTYQTDLAKNTVVQYL